MSARKKDVAPLFAVVVIHEGLLHAAEVYSDKAVAQIRAKRLARKHGVRPDDECYEPNRYGNAETDIYVVVPDNVEGR